MILGQIIRWIVKNREVYFANSKKVSLEENFIADSLERICLGLKKMIPQLLKSEKATYINHFISFFTARTKNGQISPHYQLHSDLTTIINCHLKPKLNKPNNSEDIYKLVSSSLMIERDLVQVLLDAFARAIRDMVGNGDKICLNLQFCLIKLSKKEISCSFRKSFIQDLNTKQPQLSNQPILLRLCPTIKCKQKDKQNITKSYLMFYDKKQKQIEQGNLYKRASLQQIKNLYDKGGELQIKYKNLFD